MAPEPDTVEPRISANCPADVKEILTVASSHDVASLKKLLGEPGRASCRDPETGETPLHAAVRSCGSRHGSELDLEKAKKTVHELFLFGAIWNDLDSNDETPGCVARRLGQADLYNLCVDAGVRAELLFGLLDGYEKLSSGSEGDALENRETEQLDGQEQEEAPQLVAVERNGHTDGRNAGKAEEGKDHSAKVGDETEHREPDAEEQVQAVKTEYLESRLSYSDGKLVDDAGNAVMMTWETDIMRQSVDALLPAHAEGKRVLNIGFGMGIIDSMFAEANPLVHHIVEAHPGVIARLSEPDSKFGLAWEAQASEAGAYKVFHGRWQDICPTLLVEGQQYDAIYFDTFGEDYSQLRNFFTEYVLGLLDGEGIFSFFNGLGADRSICYDVYTKVVEVHLLDAGLDVDWKTIDVDLTGMGEAGKDEWAGVKRRYWTLDKYRLPICTFLG